MMFNKTFRRLVAATLCMSLCAANTSANTISGGVLAAEITETQAFYGETAEESEISPTTVETATEEDLSEEPVIGESEEDLSGGEETADNETSNSETTEEETTEEETTEEETAEEETLHYNADKAALIDEAEDAFDSLLKEKNLMALLYHTDSYNVQKTAGGYDNTAATIEIGHTLYITGVEILDNEVWYQVSFGLNGEEKSGYVEAYYLAYSDEDWIAWEQEYLKDIFKDSSSTYGITVYSATDTSDIDAFPALYQESLKSLKQSHPNWVFVPMNTGLDFNTVVSNEMDDKSLIQNTSSNASKGWVGESYGSGWYYATQSAVEHYINPTNFLTESYIFQFEQLTYNSTYHTESAIQAFLNSTFMSGKIPDDSQSRTYAKAFLEIGKNRGISPIHLASRVYQEQGKGTSPLISGTYSGYEGYYNYFNVGATGKTDAEVIKNGLEYAKSKGWDTRYKSLEGGASTIGNNYILKGQDTLYLEKFNVDGNYNKLYTHQYMQNIQAPASESSTTKKMYSDAGSLNSGFVFKIPVYKNMPGEKAIQSISLDKDSVTLYRPDVIEGGLTDLSSTATLKVSFTPADTSDSTAITWNSSNTKVVTVTAGSDTTGATITAIDTGTATVTAKSSNGKTAVCTVTVEAPVYSISISNLNDDTSTIYTGQSITLTADYLPRDTTSDTSVINWESSNTSVATVSKGKVTALSKGTALITASIEGISSAPYSVKVEDCTVTFMSETGSILEEFVVNYGSCMSDLGKKLPNIETPSGKVFIGWYTDKNGQGTRFDENTPIYAQNTTVYPYFADMDNSFYVIPVGDQTYTGSAITPEVTVYEYIKNPDGTTTLATLVKNTDYTVSYKNNKNVNTSDGTKPTITIKGKGNYSGTADIYFNILPKAISDNDITADNITAAYNAKVQKLSPTVYCGSKKLTLNTDYTLEYPYADSGAYKAAGVYPIVIKGKGNYNKTITVYETISNKTLISKASIAKIPNQPYSSAGVYPSLSVTYNKEPLTESTDGGKTGDYTVSYKNNTAAGTATAIITAVDGSAFAGSKSVTFKITGTPINKASISGIKEKTYTGNEDDVKQSQMSVVVDGILLRENTDYTVSYSNISKAGTATVVFKGINGYSGQVKKTYKITGCNIDYSNITFTYATQDAPNTFTAISNLSQITSPYTKGGTKPQLKLYSNGTALTLGKDYTVKYSNNNAVTDSTVSTDKLPLITITGKGNFKGTLTGTWTITDASLSDDNSKVTMSAKDVVYKNKVNAYQTTVTLTDANGSKLAAGKDYDKNLRYTYENDTTVATAEGGTATRSAGSEVESGDILNVGTVIRVAATGLGAYAGSGSTKSTTYRIITTDILKAKVTVSAKSWLNGAEVKLTPEDITVIYGGTSLDYGTDYIIDESTYTNNTKKGKASVVIRGIGDTYGGEKKITFTIGSKSIFGF